MKSSKKPLRVETKPEAVAAPAVIKSELTIKSKNKDIDDI